MAELKFPFINNVIISGRVTRDVYLKTTPSGTTVINFSIANTRYYRDNSSDTGFSERTTFVNVVVWGDLAERLQNVLVKGTPVIIEGILEENRWEDRNTGQRRSRIEIRAQRVHVLSKNDENDSSVSQELDSIDDEIDKYFKEGAGVEDEFSENKEED